MADKPRSFKETVAAKSPPIGRGLRTLKASHDVTVSNPFHQQVSVIEDAIAEIGESSISMTTAHATSRRSPDLKPRSGRGIISRRLIRRLRAVRA